MFCHLKTKLKCLRSLTSRQIPEQYLHKFIQILYQSSFTVIVSNPYNAKPNAAGQSRVARLCSERGAESFEIQVIQDGAPAILIKAFHDFLQSFQVNAVVIPGNRPFPPQFIVHSHSYYNLTLYNLAVDIAQLNNLNLT